MSLFSQSNDSNEEIIIRQSADDVKRKFGGWWYHRNYYKKAETAMKTQFDTIILPFLRDQPIDYSKTIELSPGHGRNTNILKNLADELHLVDYNKSCIEFCKKRFRHDNACRFFYYVNDGKSLRAIPNNSMTFVYSWDSMVHFDRLLVRAYLKEFHRCLVTGGSGFVHHSNYGDITGVAGTKISQNPHWRSNMSRALFREYCVEIGLEILDQRLLDWGVKNLDCLSVFRKPS